jgi:3'-phosphoadenosine 5'-phosphosulfate sulfotransferase (PAPS reductase)/FAD synthetase
MEVKYIICFSGGRSSALALYKMLDKVATGEAVVIFNNTGKEREETLEFVQKIADSWEVPITWLEYANNEKGYKVVTFETASRAGEPFAAAIDKKNGFLPNRVIRYCTEILKITPTRKYLKDVELADARKVLGIRYDEPARVGKQKDAYLPLNEARITKADVRHFWARQPFDLQLKDYEGNCDLCMLKGKNKRLTLIAENPEIVTWWVEQETKSGGRFDKDGTVTQLAQLARGNFPHAKDFLEIGQGDIFNTDIGCFCGD